MNALKSQSGLTLLEVVIATAILAILSIYTAESVQNAVKSKVKVEKEVDRVTGVRDVLRIMERDINMAFHYRDINIDLYNLAEKERIDRLNKGTDTTKKDENKKPDEEKTEEEKKKEEEEKKGLKKRPISPKSLPKSLSPRNKRF